MRHGAGRTLARAVLAVVMGITGVAVSEAANPATAGAACAAATQRLGGSVQGEDGRYISSLIGISLFTANGTKIGPDGCATNKPGYTTHVKVNTYAQPGLGYILPGEGSRTTPYFDGSQNHNLTKAWSITGLPSNADYAWMEIYTGGHGSDPSNDRYGHSRRRPVNVGRTNIVIRQPLNCGLSEAGVTGTTGRLVGRVFQDGRPVTPDKVIAFNSRVDQDNGGPIVGFNSLNDHADDRYVAPSLSPGPYTLFVYKGSLSVRVDGLSVRACRDTTEDISVRGALPDIPAWANDAIYWLLDNGHAAGYPGGNFRPNHAITRAQIARMLHRIAGSPPPTGDCGELTDVPPWAEDAICWLVDKGHATGYDDLTFRPDRPIRRAAAARMLYRIVLATPSAGDCGNLTDVPTWAAEAICWLVDNGHMSGFADGRFKPNERITRAQTANVLYSLNS